MKIDIDKIILERAKQNLTLEELARKSGVGASTLSKIVIKKAKPRLSTTVKIAKGLGKDIEDFIVID